MFPVCTQIPLVSKNSGDPNNGLVQFLFVKCSITWTPFDQRSHHLNGHSFSGLFIDFNFSERSPLYNFYSYNNPDKMCAFKFPWTSISLREDETLNFWYPLNSDPLNLFQVLAWAVLSLWDRGPPPWTRHWSPGLDSLPDLFPRRSRPSAAKNDRLLHQQNQRRKSRRGCCQSAHPRPLFAPVSGEHFEQTERSRAPLSFRLADDVD